MSMPATTPVFLVTICVRHSKVRAAVTQQTRVETLKCVTIHVKKKMTKPMRAGNLNSGVNASMSTAFCTCRKSRHVPEAKPISNPTHKLS